MLYRAASWPEEEGIDSTELGRQTSLGLRCQLQPLPHRPGLHLRLVLAACAPPPTRKGIMWGALPLQGRNAGGDTDD